MKIRKVLSPNMDLISCPRCGFSQPKDRYCASCGVDIVNYRPPSDPLLKRTLRQPLFYLLLIASLLVASVFFIHERNMFQLMSFNDLQRKSTLVMKKGLPPEDQTQIVSEEKAAASLPSSVDPNSEPLLKISGPNATKSPGAENESNLAFNQEQEEESPPEETSENVRAERLKNMIWVKAHFAEVTLASIEKLRGVAEEDGHYQDLGDVKVLQIPKLKNLMAKEKGITILQSISKGFEGKNGSHRIFAGSKLPDGSEELGLQIQIMMSPGAGDTVRGQISMAQKLKELPNVPPSEKTLPSTAYNIEVGSSIVMILNLPQVSQDEKDLISDPWMRVFNSSQFQKKQTLFTLLLEFDRSQASANQEANNDQTRPQNRN